MSPLSSHDQTLSCFLRTLLVPTRYRTSWDAMGLCQALGDDGSYLRQFTDYKDYVKFYNAVLANPAMQKYCDHGGRYMMWLPYQGWSEVTDNQVNVTYYKSSEPLQMNEAWRKNNPKNTNRPYCVIARMGKDIFW